MFPKMFLWIFIFLFPIIVCGQFQYNQTKKSSVSDGFYPFSIQINIGYNYFFGQKINHIDINSQSKYTLGSFNKGLVPIEIDFKYNPVYFFSVLLGYGYNISIPYTYTITSSVMGKTTVAQCTYNLPTQILKIGEIFYLGGEDKLWQPYLGIDINVFFSKISSQINNRKNTSSTFTTAGLMPKLGLARYFDHFFVNAEFRYLAIFPTQNSLYNYLPNVTNGLSATLGCGYRFAIKK